MYTPQKPGGRDDQHNENREADSNFKRAEQARGTASQQAKKTVTKADHYSKKKNKNNDFYPHAFTFGGCFFAEAPEAA